jgi:hypothetical protein
MVLDFSTPGETRVSIEGFVEDMLETGGVTGGAKTPATEGLFELRADALTCTESRRKEFHLLVAKMLYHAKKSRPECLAAVAFLATRVTKCTEHDWEKLTRLLRYINDTKERGIVLRPGKCGIIVRVFIDAAYGVHADGKSHTGSCVVIGDSGADRDQVFDGGRAGGAVGFGESRTAHAELPHCPRIRVRAHDSIPGQYELHGTHRERAVSGGAHASH